MTPPTWRGSLVTCRRRNRLTAPVDRSQLAPSPVRRLLRILRSCHFQARQGIGKSGRAAPHLAAVSYLPRGTPPSIVGGVFAEPWMHSSSQSKTSSVSGSRTLEQFIPKL